MKWLLKTESNEWSWTMQLSAKTTTWHGVRNYQANNYLKQMKMNDLAFFYHSGKEKQIVGIVKIIKEAYPDITDQDKKFVCVDVQTHLTLKNPVSLSEIKQNPQLKHLLLVKQSRLSVMPIDEQSWQIILKLSNTTQILDKLNSC